MSTGASVSGALPQAPEPQLSQMSRLVNAFVAPSATFTDIRRSASWWVPWLLMAILQVAFAFAIDQKFGWDTVLEQQIAKNPSAQARLDGFKPEQREQVLQSQAKITKYVAYAAPVRILIVWTMVAAIFMAVFKFGFGADIPFTRSLATWAYSTMPLSISFVLTIVAVYATSSSATFDLNNPVATNLGYFIDPKNSKLLYWLGSCVDVFDIWVIVLAGIGYSIASNNKVKRTTAMAIFAAVFVLMRGLGALRA